jgi:hypothetical protein
VFTNSAAPSGVPTNRATLTVTTAPPNPPEQSQNWSGYVDTGATFSAVNASWIVPTVTCTQGENAYSAHWIGIDGNTSSTVEQDGTEADCLTTTTGGFTYVGGQFTYGGTAVTSASYDAWFEMYGDNAVNQGYEEELSPSTNPVTPGDSMSSSVSVVGNEWTLTISDSSSSHAAWHFSTSVAFSGAAQSSAEWVAERPEICSNSCSLASLADFGSVTFSGATATTTGGSSEPISSYSDAAIEMVNGSTVLAVPGPLNSNGFTDTWKAT